MRLLPFMHSVAAGATALLIAGTFLMPSSRSNGPVLMAAVNFVSPKPMERAVVASTAPTPALAIELAAALESFTKLVHPLSRPRALEVAFHSYFAYRAKHPDQVTKPFLYFVDFGLPSTMARGYLFDMSQRTIIDGPFTVAHGRGSSSSRYGIPTHFSNVSGSAATSLGLYVAQATYGFRGKSAGQAYRSVGLRLLGISRQFNDNALSRGVVAHGAPYVTADRAGRSEGCPAMEPARAERLLPKLANGGMVFLFAPDERLMAQDPWLVAGTE